MLGMGGGLKHIYLWKGGHCFLAFQKILLGSCKYFQAPQMPLFPGPPGIHSGV